MRSSWPWRPATRSTCWGRPEGYLPLAEMTIYLATAPKSNSAKVALGAALEAARETPAAPVPLHIRNAPTAADEGAGLRPGYRYAHDSPDAYLPQEYLPDALRGATFYTPGAFGHEKKIAERLEWWAKLKSGEEERERGRRRSGSEPRVCDSRTDRGWIDDPAEWYIRIMTIPFWRGLWPCSPPRRRLAGCRPVLQRIGDIFKEPDVQLDRVVVRGVGLQWRQPGSDRRGWTIPTASLCTGTKLEVGLRGRGLASGRHCVRRRFLGDRERHHHAYPAADVRVGRRRQRGSSRAGLGRSPVHA